MPASAVGTHATSFGSSRAALQQLCSCQRLGLNNRGITRERCVEHVIRSAQIQFSSWLRFSAQPQQVLQCMGWIVSLLNRQQECVHQHTDNEPQAGAIKQGCAKGIRTDPCQNKVARQMTGQQPRRAGLRTHKPSALESPLHSNTQVNRRSVARAPRCRSPYSSGSMWSGQCCRRLQSQK